MNTAEYVGLLVTIALGMAAIGIPIILASRQGARAAVRVANRIEGLLRDFPPHRHVGDSVIYADGFEPTAVETLELHKRGASA